MLDSPAPVRFVIAAVAGVAALIASGQRWDTLDPQLGPSQAVIVLPSEPPPASARRPRTTEEMAQFEDIDDALLAPLQTPSLPDAGDLQPFGEELMGEEPATVEPTIADEPVVDEPMSADPQFVVPLKNDGAGGNADAIGTEADGDTDSEASGGEGRNTQKPFWLRDDVAPQLRRFLSPGGNEEDDDADESDRRNPERDFAPSEGDESSEGVGPSLPDPPDSLFDNGSSAPTVRRALRVSDLPPGQESVRLAIGGAFLGQLFARTGCNSGPVEDCILEARVSGRQTTQTRTNLVLVPDAGAARMNLLLTGENRSSTVGRTDQASVLTESRNLFQLEKPITFDGQQFLTASPGAYVWPEQQTRGAAATVGQNIPLVRRMASRIAYEEAARRRPAAQRIAADKLTQKVAGQFNSRTDAGLSKLQSVWQERALDGLTRLMMDPQAPRTSTTASHMVLALPTSTARPATQPPPRWEDAGEAITLAVHESAINGAMARLGLEGRELQPGAWAELVGRVLPSAVVEAADEADAPAVSLATLRLLDRDPVAVRFERGRVEIELRAVVSTPLGESDPLRIVMPWQVRATPDRTRIACGEVEVEPFDGESGGVMAIVRTGIETRFAEEIKPLSLPRTLTAPLGEGRELPLTLSFYRSRDGWLLLGWRSEG